MIRASDDQPMIPGGYEISPVFDPENKWKEFSLLSPFFSMAGENHFPYLQPRSKWKDPAERIGGEVI
jgi:hypothetical protein